MKREKKIILTTKQKHCSQNEWCDEIFELKFFLEAQFNPCSLFATKRKDFANFCLLGTQIDIHNFFNLLSAV